MEGMFLKTGKKIYEQMTRYWIRILPSSSALA
jgi:hypothetical protein